MTEGSVPYGSHAFVFVEPLGDEEAASLLAAELSSVTGRRSEMAFYSDGGALYSLDLELLDDRRRRRVVSVARRGQRQIEVAPPSRHWLELSFDDVHSLKVRFVCSEKVSDESYLVQRLLHALWREGESIDAGSGSSAMLVDSVAKAQFLLRAAANVGADITLAVPQTVVESVGTFCSS